MVLYSVACLILVLDEKGLIPVFGVPAVRRLVLLAQKWAWNRSTSSAVWSPFGPRSPTSFLLRRSDPWRILVHWSRRCGDLRYPATRKSW